MTFRVAIERSDFTDELRFFWGYEQDHQLYVAQPVEICYTLYTEGEPSKPVFTMGSLFAREFLKAFTEMLEKHGFIPRPDETSHGREAAILYHLEDLRTLLHLPSPDTHDPGGRSSS